MCTYFPCIFFTPWCFEFNFKYTYNKAITFIPITFDTIATMIVVAMISVVSMQYLLLVTMLTTFQYF